MRKKRTYISNPWQVNINLLDADHKRKLEELIAAHNTDRSKLVRLWIDQAYSKLMEKPQ